MNNLIKRINNGNEVIFIINTEGEIDFWYWSVEKQFVDNYKGTDEEFINDYDNSHLGCSCGSFITVEDAEIDAKGGE